MAFPIIGAAPLLPALVALLRYSALFLVSLVFLLGVGAPTNLSSSFAWQFRAAARLRTPILVFLVVPLSFLRWVAGEARGRIRDWARRGTSEREVWRGHERRVGRVVGAVREWNAGGRKGKLRTARPTWMGMSVHISGKEDAHRIEVHHLNYILAVNEGDGGADGEQPSVMVEPGVTMGDLTRRLLPLGLMLDLHVEMESVTVGGAAMGFGIETNSHVSGFFQETVLSYEIVDSNGNVRRVRRDGGGGGGGKSGGGGGDGGGGGGGGEYDDDPELFHALPWSHGSVGFLTALTVRCVRVKPYVRVRYVPTRSAEELTAKLREFTEGEEGENPRFVEATLFSRDEAVIQLGDYCTLEEAQAGAGAQRPNDGGLEVHEINHFWKPFYYRYVQSLLPLPPLPGHPEGACRSELIPLKHYAHRFTRSVFWELEDMIPFSNHPLYRVLWGWLGAPEVGLLKLAQGPVVRQASVEAHVVQESIAPIRHLADCIDGFDEWFGVYPLLAFPVRIYDRGDMSGFLRPRPSDLLDGKPYGMFVDLGAYGVPRLVRSGRPWDAKSNIRKMEDWTRERGGFQALYTDVFHTRGEFRRMFDHGLLDRVRGREGVDAGDAFDEVYDRVRSRYADLEEEERLEREQEEEEAEAKAKAKEVASEADKEEAGQEVDGTVKAEVEAEAEADPSGTASAASSSSSSSTSSNGVTVPSSVGDVWQWISGGGGRGSSSRPPSPVSESTSASDT